jgi:two-component system, OmpR family, phosphate regulon sensor histidine kinase PhoR
MSSSQKSAAPPGDGPAAESPEKEECTVCRCSLQILDGLTEACIVSDTGGRLRYANEAARDLLHLRGRVTGRKLQAVLADRHALQVVDESIKSSRPRSMTLSLTFSSDGARQYEVSVLPVQVPGEEMLLRIALRPTEAVEGETLSAKTDLNPDTVQRLGDPLTIIQGYLENLLDGAIRDPVVMRQCLSAMQRQAVQIQRILNSLRS